MVRVICKSCGHAMVLPDLNMRARERCGRCLKPLSDATPGELRPRPMGELGAVPPPSRPAPGARLSVQSPLRAPRTYAQAEEEQDWESVHGGLLGLSRAVLLAPLFLLGILLLGWGFILGVWLLNLNLMVMLVLAGGGVFLLFLVLAVKLLGNLFALTRVPESGLQPLAWVMVAATATQVVLIPISLLMSKSVPLPVWIPGVVALVVLARFLQQLGDTFDVEPRPLVDVALLLSAGLAVPLLTRVSKAFSRFYRGEALVVLGVVLAVALVGGLLLRVSLRVVADAVEESL